MDISYIVMLVLAAIIVILLFSIRTLGRGNYNQLAAKMADKDRHKIEVLKPCPVCGHLNRKNETVHSVYYSKSAKGHKLPVDEIHTEIFGCPYCWPANDEHPRVCPVCKKTLPPDGFLVARTFRKPGQKDHVHVIGCTECKKVR